MGLFELKEVVQSKKTSDALESSTGVPAATKSWDELESGEWAKARRESPYIEAVGELHLKLMVFGGTFEHVRYRFVEVYAQIAQQFAPIHQRYRWYPPCGTSLFRASSFCDRFCGWLQDRGPASPEWIKLVKECGFPMTSSAEYVGLILPEGDKALLFIGIPSEGDRRYDRIPWLDAVVRAPFNGVSPEWRDLVREAWDDAWNVVEGGNRKE